MTSKGMQKLIAGGLAGLSMMAGASTPALADHHMAMNAVSVACMERTHMSDAACECVGRKAEENLSEGQIALVLSFGDWEANSLSVARAEHLNLADLAAVRIYTRWVLPACAIEYKVEMHEAHH